MCGTHSHSLYGSHAHTSHDTRTQNAVEGFHQNQSINQSTPRGLAAPRPAPGTVDAPARASDVLRAPRLLHDEQHHLHATLCAVGSGPRGTLLHGRRGRRTARPGQRSILRRWWRCWLLDNWQWRRRLLCWPLAGPGGVGGRSCFQSGLAGESCLSRAVACADLV